MLYEKQIPKALWEEILAGYPDQTDYIVRFLRARLTDDSDQRQKKRVIDALLRQGHSYSQIRRGLEMVGQENEDFLED